MRKMDSEYKQNVSGRVGKKGLEVLNEGMTLSGASQSKMVDLALAYIADNHREDFLRFLQAAVKK